jgi:hypothetical protein
VSGLSALSDPRDHPSDRKVEDGGELEIPLIVAGYGHDGAGPVLHQHVIRDPDWDALSGSGVLAVSSGEDPGLGLVRLLPRDHIHPGHAVAVRFHSVPLFRGGDRVHERMFRREHHVGGPEDGVGSGREHLDGTLPRADGETQDGPLTPTDPVLLRLPGRVGPVQRLEVLEKPGGIVRNPEEPLGDAPLLHRGVAPFTEAGHHLFVGQHRHAGGAPVHGCLLPFRDPGLEELQEEPLGPAVVFRRGRIDRMAPVEHSPHATKLAGEIGDVPGDQVHGVDPHLQREVLRVDSERVETDRLEDLLPEKALKASVHVRTCEGVDVADVQPLRRRVGEHHQVVVGSFRGAQRLGGESVRPSFLPRTLPLRLDLPGAVPVAFLVGHVRNCPIGGAETGRTRSVERARNHTCSNGKSEVNPGAYGDQEDSFSP